MGATVPHVLEPNEDIISALHPLQLADAWVGEAVVATDWVVFSSTVVPSAVTCGF